MDTMQDPMHCPHGGEFLLLEDGVAFWSTPCPTRSCETGTVAPPQRLSA